MHERIREFTVDLEEGCVTNNNIKSFAMLEAAFVKLREAIRGFPAPVVVGLPSNDVIIRPLQFPDMPIEDVRSSLLLNFDEHFPIPEHEAVFDAVIISTPPSSKHVANTITALAVAARHSCVDNLLETAHRAGLPVKAIEAVNFSLLRAITEDSEGLCIFADPRNIVTTWQGHGIFFRTANNVESFNDIRSTIQFTETQYRGVKVSKIILARVNFQLNSSPDVQVINIKDLYYPAEGLALRESSDLVLDLRPLEYIELEKRRNSMNISRILLSVLSASFVLLSIGTIIFTLVRMSVLQTEIEVTRGIVDELSAKRDVLIKDNTRLQKIKADTEKHVEFLMDDLPVLEVLNYIEANAGTGIKIENTTFAHSGSGKVVSVTVNGTASDEKSLLALSEGLKSTGFFRSVITPTTAKNANEVKFNMTLTIGEGEKKS